MNHKTSLTRREFVGCLPFALPAVASTRLLPATRNAMSAAIPNALSPVLSFHVDQLYLDKTGTAIPYLPPAGVRSGQAVSELSDVEYLSRYLYF